MMRVAVEVSTYPEPGSDAVSNALPTVTVSTDTEHSRFVQLQIGMGPVVLVVASELAEATRRACLC